MKENPAIENNTEGLALSFTSQGPAYAVYAYRDGRMLASVMYRATDMETARRFADAQFLAWKKQFAPNKRTLPLLRLFRARKEMPA